MFGLIISGRPVDAQPQAITDAQYAFKVPPAPAFSHIVVFLLPGAVLPEGTAATVYVQIPPSPEFKLLGAIGPGKESAIFQVSGLRSGNADENAGIDAPATAAAGGEIVVGASIEPIPQVEAQLAVLKAAAPTAGAAKASTAMVRVQNPPHARVATKVLAQRIIGNAFNFLASFGSDTIPLKAFQAWWDKFEKKVELDPSFLERGE